MQANISFEENNYAWDQPGVGQNLVYMTIEGVVFFLLVLLTEVSPPYILDFIKKALGSLSCPESIGKFENKCGKASEGQQAGTHIYSLIQLVGVTPLMGLITINRREIVTARSLT